MRSCDFLTSSQVPKVMRIPFVKGYYQKRAFLQLLVTSKNRHQFRIAFGGSFVGLKYYTLGLQRYIFTDLPKVNLAYFQHQSGLRIRFPVFVSMKDCTETRKLFYEELIKSYQRCSKVCYCSLYQDELHNNDQEIKLRIVIKRLKHCTVCANITFIPYCTLVILTDFCVISTALGMITSLPLL